MNAEIVNNDKTERNLRMRGALEAGRRESEAPVEVDQIGPLRDAIREVLPEGWTLVDNLLGWTFFNGKRVTKPRSPLWIAVRKSLGEMLEADPKRSELHPWPARKHAAALADAMGAMSRDWAKAGQSVEDRYPKERDQAFQILQTLLRVLRPHAGSTEGSGEDSDELADAPDDEGLAAFCHLLNLAEMYPDAQPEARYAAAARGMLRLLRQCAPIVSQMDDRSVRGVREWLEFAERRPKEAARLLGEGRRS